MPKLVRTPLVLGVVCSGLMACSTTSKPIQPLAYPSGKTARVWINTARDAYPNEKRYSGQLVEPPVVNANTVNTIPPLASASAANPQKTESAKVEANAEQPKGKSKAAETAQRTEVTVVPTSTTVAAAKPPALPTISETKLTLIKNADLKETITAFLQELSWGVEWNAPLLSVAETQKFVSKTEEGVLALILRKFGLAAEKYEEEKTYVIQPKK
jgi:hypothetical protein